MLTDELTVFDIKYNEAMERLDNLLSMESSYISVKNYVDRYRLDKSQEKNSAKVSRTHGKSLPKDEKRKQIVDLFEIRRHEKKVQQFMNKNYLKNEIEWFKIREREDEHRNKYNYRPKYDGDTSLNNRDDLNNKNLIMKKFSNLATKVNIQKILSQKKLNQMKLSQINNKVSFNTNNYNYDDGIFIPYVEYSKIEGSPIISKITNNNRNNQKINRISKIVKNNSQNSIPKTNLYKNNNQNININRNININYSINFNSDRKNPKVLESQSSSKNKSKSALKNKDNIYNIEKRKPLEHKIDYLRQIRISKEKQGKIYGTESLFKNKKMMNDLELLNIHSKKCEEDAKKQELLMKVKGKKKYSNDDNIKLSNILVDSISTKLAILKHMSNQSN